MRQLNQDADIGPLVVPAEARCTLELLATGLGGREVAARLGCSVDDVHTHLARAIRALGATSKLEAILEAARQGLIDLAGRN